MVLINGPHEKTGFLHIKTQISCAVTAQLISIFVLASHIVLSLFFLKFEISTFYPTFVTVQAHLCQTWSERQKV